MKTLLTTKVVAALALLLFLSASVALADDVTIKSVDNYAGNSNVYTDKANTTITVTELDADKSPVRSWTGTTDSEGKITIPAGSNLSKDYLKAKLGSENQQAGVEGIVVPDNIYDAQPFSFAATGGGRVEGEVVTLQTAEGTVVQQGRADKYGRVFLAAGLPAGAYLVGLAARDGQHEQPAGHIQVKQRPSDALERPWEHPPQPLQLRNAPQALKKGELLSLGGHGFSPNFADMQAIVSGASATQIVPVLAATEDQLKLAPVGPIQPGTATLSVKNLTTGQSTEPQNLFLYDMQARLVKTTLHTGHDQTQLIVNIQPENVPMPVQARVVSGPVDFGGGRKESQAISNNGQAIFPVYAGRGAGPFQLAWTLGNSAFAATDPPSTPKEWLEEKAKDCQKGADKSQNSNNQSDLKKEAELDQDAAKNKKNWGNDGQPADKNKFGKFLNDEIKRLKKILKKEGETGNGKESIEKAIDDAIEAGKAAGLDF